MLLCNLIYLFIWKTLPGLLITFSYFLLMKGNNFFNIFLSLPENGQMWYLQPASPVMEGIVDLQLEMSFHFIYILTLVVYGLGGSIILFNENQHRFSSRVSHWTTLERIYSIIPMISIVCIYAPSFSLLYAMDEYPDSFVCVKVVGRQWYWHYEVTYDGFTHYDNIAKFSETKVLNDSVVKFKSYFYHIRQTSDDNLSQIKNINRYNNKVYNKHYIVKNKFGWCYKQRYSLHLKLFADIHKNLVSLPKITNYAFDSYVLSDYTLKSKYLAPKILLKSLVTGRPINNIYLKSYLINNPELTIEKFPYFRTFRTTRLFETSKALILPAGTVIRALVTASDVIHSWSIPALGVKTDGVPGRLNQVFFAIVKNGVYYGQCSELCGQYHFAMPIVIKAMHWYSCFSPDCFWCHLRPSFSEHNRMQPVFWSDVKQQDSRNTMFPLPGNLSTFWDEIAEKYLIK